MTPHTAPWARLPWLVLLAALLPCRPGIALGRQGEPVDDRTLSPYFFVTSDDAAADQLPLKQTWADVDVVGVIADVTVVQRYANEGDTALEAVYVFPASTRAAVHAMTMTVGERVIEAVIQEREEARETYERARHRGQTATLLEQQRPNVFQMAVANIQPGDEVEVVLCYTELLVPVEGVYEFVYPTVVGPRYGNAAAEDAPEAERWIANPYLHEGESAAHTLALDLRIHSGIPLAAVTSPSHDIVVDDWSDREVEVAIPASVDAGNRDVVIRYTLAGDDVETGLLLLPPDEFDAGTFLLMVEPPEWVAAAEIVPREVVFVVDVSGSMAGFPLEVSKELMRSLLERLRPGDHLNVLFFAGGSSLLAERSLPATPDNVRRAVEAVDAQRGGGGTELLPALERALDLPRVDEGVARVIVVATDGYVTVEPEAFELVRERGDDASVFAFGIGRSVNRALVEGLARAGMGEPFVALDEASAREMARRFQRYVESPVLTDIEVAFEGVEVVDVEPPVIPDLFAERPVVVFGRYDGSFDGEIVISGATAGGRFERVIDSRDAAVAEGSDALRLLWARHRIARLSDMNLLREDDARLDEVTELGLEYGLLTATTSFVAVDRRRRGDGTVETVTQPLPLPQGVSDLAVGLGGAGAAAGGGGWGCGVLTSRGRGYFTSAAGGVPSAPAGKGGGITVVETSVPDGQTVILGALDRTVIDRVMRQHMDRIRRCYQRGLENDPSLEGTLVFRIVIGADGAVTRATILSSTLGDPQVEREILEVIESMVFPAPKGGGVVTVTYPLEFHASR